MVTAPDALPVLSRGRHRHPSRGACFLEYTALLAGEPFSDAPRCVDRQLAAVLRHANDRLCDADRPRLLPLLGRAIGLVVDPAVPGRARMTAGLHQLVAARFMAAVGFVPTGHEWWLQGAGREVDPLFWHLMDHPFPVPTSAGWVARLLPRLDLLHGCYEDGLAELGLRETLSRRPTAAGAV
jgi:hypothetical protein